MSQSPTGRKQYDVVIVGGGAAGLSAAVMLGRARRSVAVVDAGQPRNRFAPHMHGLLTRDGMSPRDLLERGRAEAQGYGVEVLTGEVTSIEREGTGFRVSGPQELGARQVVIATGLRDILPAVPGLEEMWGTGAVVCPYCDGWEVRDQPIGVLATSPMSRNQVHLLRQWTSELTVLGASEAGIADDELALIRARGIRLAPPALEVGGVSGDVVIRTAAGNHEVARVFVGARPRPSSELLVSLGCEMAQTPAGPFVRVDSSGRTSESGVWAIGNVSEVKALVPVAIGAGTLAATQINIALVEEEIAQLHVA